MVSGPVGFIHSTNHPDALPVNDPLTTDPFESSMTDFFPDVSPMEEMTCSQSPPGQSSVSLPDVSPVNSVPQVQSSIAPLLASDVGDSANKPDVANNPAKADVMMTVEPLSTPRSPHNTKEWIQYWIYARFWTKLFC